MSLSVIQAIEVANYFQEGDRVNELKIIKRLTPEQRDICYQAFKIVERATLSDVNAPEVNPLQADKIRDLKTSLEAPLEAEEPDDTAWYAKPFYFIAHKISSFAKGLANIFWRVGSGALYDKASDYRVDIRNYKQKIVNYHNETGEGDDVKPAGYKDIDNKINQAKGIFDNRIIQAMDLEDLYIFCVDLQTSINAEEFKKQRLDSQKLSEETLSHTGSKNDSPYTLYEIVRDEVVKKIDLNVPLQKEIFGPISTLIETIDTEKSTVLKDALEALKQEHGRKINQIKEEAKPPEMDQNNFEALKLEKFQSEKSKYKEEKKAVKKQVKVNLLAKERGDYSKRVAKELRRAVKEISKRHNAFVEEDGSLDKAREDLEAKIAKHRKMESKESLLTKKYPAIKV